MGPHSTRRVVAVVVGGESGEHEISLRSGAEVVAALDHKRWVPLIVRIERDGSWCFPGGRDVRGLATCLSLSDGIAELLRRDPALVFPVMHGPYGEDGRFQALVELLHLPCAGSGAETSALAMNKARARDILSCAGMKVAPAQELLAGETCRIDPPCVVKPLRLGSSVGVMLVKTAEALQEALEEAFTHDERVLVEAFVEGRELTAGVLETAEGAAEALPLVEIRPVEGSFFDFHAKYTPGATEEICPAPVSAEVTAEVQRLGLLAHRVLACRGMSRTDVIVDAQDTVWVLETNTIPGMTRTSLLPQAAETAGIPFPILLDRILERALL